MQLYKTKRLKSTLYKSLKYIKLKITPTCFGSYVIHHQGVWSCILTEIICSGSQIFVLCLIDVWQRNFEPVVCVSGTTAWELLYPLHVSNLNAHRQVVIFVHAAYTILPHIYGLSNC